MILLKRQTSQAQTLRLDSMRQILQLITAPSGTRAIEDLIDAKGLAVLMSLLRNQDHAIQLAAARLLQEIAARGYYKHLFEHPGLFPALAHAFHEDCHEVNAAAAAIVAALRPAPPLLELLPMLARILNFEAEAARLDAARAIHGLITSPELFYDIREYQDGKLMEQATWPPPLRRRACPSRLTGPTSGS